MLKTRFAPSPTGRMHLGNLRTALYNVLLAKSQNGTFLLRVEDTDKERSERAHEDALQTDLKWLSLDWQEGPVVGGDNGPYRQSERDGVYQGYYDTLTQKGLAYPCFCSEQELSVQRKLDLSAGRAPRYSGKCRHLTQEQCAAKQAEGKTPTLRLKVPDDERVRFDDLIMGPKQFESKDLGDFIIRKADGGPTFMFCNAIDDALMGVTHALRGEDHITNTPRQLIILNYLGLRTPNYGHFPIILALDGKPLSKRNGSLSVEELRERGYLPIAVLNYLARLGHAYEETGLLSFEDLGKHFSLERVGKSPAKFDHDQLDWWQHQTILTLSDAEIVEWLTPGRVSSIPEAKRSLFLQLVREACHFPEDVEGLKSAYFGDALDYSEEAITWLTDVGSSFLEAVAVAIQSEPSLPDAIKAVQKATGRKGKQLFMPIRVALTGLTHGPSMQVVETLLGAERIQARLKQAMRLIGGEA